MKQTALLFLLAACGNDQQAGPTHAPEAAAAVPAAPTLAELVDDAEVVDAGYYDATSLHGEIATYLVTRTGECAASVRAQREDVSLLLVAGPRVLRFEVGRFDVAPSPTFGAMTAAASFTARDYDPDRDAYEGAPRWTPHYPVLLATVLADRDGVTHAYVVARDDTHLGVYRADSDIDMDQWRAEVELELADDARLVLADPPSARERPGAVAVRIDERVLEDLVGYRDYVTSVRIGERVGPLAEASALADRDQPWRYGPRPDLPDPPRGVLIASRVYDQHEPDIDTRALVRDDGALVMWRRGYREPWTEELRVAIPRSARLDLTTAPARGSW